MELADTSAWTNRHRSAVTAADFQARLEGGLIATCEMVELELLSTARDHPDFLALREDLDALERTSITPMVWTRATDVFEALAAAGPLHHRRVKLPDLLIAAAAETAGLPVCHYDADFDLIADVTGQPVRAIAPLGSLG
ncbi:MAG: PIN domain-containing protein [Gaiellaceae bacterium]